MTKYAVRTIKNSETSNIALFTDSVDRSAITTFCFEVMELDKSLDNIYAVDYTTGEIFFDYEEETAPCWEDDDDWDREMGFDPYEGCYTYDC